MFEWDEGKSRKNLRQRGFDFAFAVRIFDRDVLEHEDARHHYGERRIVALGEIEGEVFVIVYTWRGDLPQDHFRTPRESEGTQCLSSGVRPKRFVKVVGA